MADQQQPREEVAGGGAPGAGPPSWFSVLLGLAIVCVAAVLAGMLILQYLQSRPLNLQPHAAQIASEVSQLLTRHYVTDADIDRAMPIPLEDAHSRWSLYRFNVNVPPQLNASGLRAVIRDSMRDAHEELVEVFDNPRDGALSIALAGRVFVEVAFEESNTAPLQAQPQAPQGTDLRAATTRIAGEVEQILVDRGVPEDSIERIGPAGREDEDTLWTFTRLRIVLPEATTLADMEAEILSRMVQRTVSTVISAPTPEAAVLRLAYAGKDCVAVEALRLRTTPVTSGQSEEVEGMAEPEGARPGGDVPAQEALPLESADHVEQPAMLEPVPPPARGGKSRVAIILDDGGYGGAVTDSVLALSPKLTLAILPYTPHDATTATAAAKLGFEVMLHMPMETNSQSVAAYPGMLTTAMEDKEIKGLTRRALAEIPGVKGVNNHTGSKFTSNAVGMGEFLSVLKEDGLFFVDSRTINTSIAYNAALEAGVPTAERQVFLDNKADQAYIRGQLNELVARARAQGSAIGIGHFRKDTVAVLAAGLPKLEAEPDLELVHVSELLQ